MELLNKLQQWYQQHCDGYWEYLYGVTIETIANPGWMLRVDLSETLLEEVDFETVKMGNSESKDEFWVDCCKEDTTFIAMGSSDSLDKLITIFLDWADRNIDTSSWDFMVSDMIEQCQSCNDIELLRKLYSKIDDIPNEHPKKHELVEEFYKKWNSIINN